MNILRFIKQRELKVEWEHLNGYGLDDPENNGQFPTLRKLIGEYSVFIDIGANLGAFADQVRDQVDDCILFEPIPELAAKLREKYRQYVLEKALGNTIEETSFTILTAEDSFASSSQFERTLMMPSYTDQRRTIQVKMDKLDSYETDILKLAASGAFIKIDVEGGELFALQGAQETLSKLERVFVMFEYGFGWKESNTTLKGAFHLLNRLGFAFYRITPLGLEQIRFYTLDMEDYRYCNYLAVKNSDLTGILPKTHVLATPHGETTFHEF